MYESMVIADPSIETPDGASARAGDRQLVYLDYAATTPVDDEVLAAMLPYFTHDFGNPSSRRHAKGWAAQDAVEASRAEVASLLGAKPTDLVFTSGATESNFAALLGLGRSRAADARRHVVSSPLEHKSVLASLEALEQAGLDVTWVAPRADGRTHVDDVLAAVRPDTLVVSLMWVNNEIGVVNPIPELARALATTFPDVVLHTDATQALGKIPIDLSATPIDLLSVSAHKLYGPKGVGALYVRESARASIAPLMRGGGQERGMRGGTLNVPGIVGFGRACAVARRRFDDDVARIRELAGRLFARVRAGFPEVILNGAADERVPGNLSLSFPGIDGEALHAALGEDVAVSSGAACAAGSAEVSHVLRGIGLDDALARATVRVVVGRMTTPDEVDLAATRMLEALDALRRRGPTGSAPDARPEGDAPTDMRLRPIGRVVNDVLEPTYIAWRRTRSRVVIDPVWAAALDGLAEYSHVIVVFWMHEVSSCKLTHVPQARFDDVPEVGMFACRCPYRPNPIAVTTVRLVEVRGLELVVEGLDAVHDTPIIDLKPYTPRIDAVEGEVRFPAWVDRLTF